MKAIIGKAQASGIHFIQTGNIGQGFFGDTLLRAQQHISRQVNAGDLYIAGKMRQRQAGADADIQHMLAARAIGNVAVYPFDHAFDIFAPEQGKGEILMAGPFGIGTAYIIRTDGGVNSHKSFRFFCYYSET